jgi:type III secretion protein V
LVFPRLHVEHADGVPSSGYEILVEDVPVSRGALRPGWRLLDPSAATVLPAGAEVAEPFGPFARVAWVRGTPADVPTWTCEEVLGRHVDQVVRRNAPRLIGLQEVQCLLRTVQADAPELAAEVSRAVPAQRIAEVLRRLLQEDIPVRNLHAIFESLALRGAAESDVIALTELVRIDLGRYITSRHAGPSRRIEAILFESSLLDRVLAAIERSARGNLLLLSPAVAQDVRDQVHGILGETAGTAVAIVSSDARRYVKTLLEPIAPELAVLSYQELDADVALHPVGWVTNPQAA